MADIHWAGWVDDPRVQQTGNLPIRSYPSGEPLVGFPPNIHIEKVLLRPSSMLDFMGGLFFIDALLERGHEHLELILPFVPGARQDRLNDAGDFLFTAKSISKEINARGFRKVTVLDPHSEVTPALIDRCHVFHAHECIGRLPVAERENSAVLVRGAQLLLDTDVYSAVVSPDSGAEKRAGAVAKKLKIPMVHGWKTRDVATGNITGFGLERANIGGRVLVVDDICDGGGTFIGLASVLKERDLKADLFVTHGIFSQGTAKLLEHYGRVFCTDSIEAQHHGIDIIQVCKRLIGGTDA